MRDAVIVEAVRTPVGKRKGGLAGVHPADLSAHVLGSLAERAGIDPAVVDDVIWGCVSQVGEQTFDIARTALLAAGWPETVTGVTVDRQCGSSQQSVHFAAAGLVAGHYDVVVAGGVESMTRVPMGSSIGDADPFGPRFMARYDGVFPNQGIGAVSMITGSPPASTAVCTRAIGVNPSSRALSEVVISSAADPSEICELLAAVITPSGLNAGFSCASPSTLPPRRMPSSFVTTVPSGSGTGAIWASNRPSSCAAAASSSDTRSSQRRITASRSAVFDGKCR